MTTPLTLVPGSRADGTALLTVTGEIDMTNCGGFEAALADTEGKVVVDLTAVNYLDSAGLSVLFFHAHRIEIIAPALLVPVLEISGLTGLTPLQIPDADPTA